MWSHRSKLRRSCSMAATLGRGQPARRKRSRPHFPTRSAAPSKDRATTWPGRSLPPRSENSSRSDDRRLRVRARCYVVACRAHRSGSAGRLDHLVEVNDLLVQRRERVVVRVPALPAPRRVPDADDHENAVTVLSTAVRTAAEGREDEDAGVEDEVAHGASSRSRPATATFSASESPYGARETGFAPNSRKPVPKPVPNSSAVA